MSTSATCETREQLLRRLNEIRRPWFFSRGLLDADVKVTLEAGATWWGTSSETCILVGKKDFSTVFAFGNARTCSGH